MEYGHQPPYPKKPYKQNRLFSGGPNSSLNACVGNNGGPYGLTDYARGYMKAGRRLADSLKKSSLYVDSVVYPLVFVYRHAVELFLKQLATYLPLLSDDKSNVALTHKLTDNWCKTKECLLRYESTFDPDDRLIAFVDAVIMDLVEIDPDGQAFRFPHARNESKFLEKTSLINVEVFADAMDSVGEALDFWIYAAADMLEAKWDD